MNKETKDVEYLVHRTFFGSSHDSYNFSLDIMKDSSDLLTLVEQANECDGDIENGAVLIVTEKQYVMSFNRGRGNGAHDSTIARIYADITDQSKLDYQTVKDYCHNAEKTFIHARFYSEKESKMSKISNILAFSFNRDKKISREEFISFSDFFNEYSWVIKRNNFDTSFAGKTMTIDEIKLYLESMIDDDFKLSDIFKEEETIIGTPTNIKTDVKKKALQC